MSRFSNPPRSASPALVVLGVSLLALCGCGSSVRQRVHPDVTPAPRSTLSPAVAGTPAGSGTNVYSADAPGMFSPQVRNVPARVYVPNSMSNTVDVIDQHTFKIVDHYPVGALPQHVTPSYDLRTLYVENDLGNSLIPIDPVSGRPAGRALPVRDPYNLYFTPNGRYAIVVAEALRQLDFRDAHTMTLHRSLSVAGCPGVDHMDFSADGRFLYASCEFGGNMIEVDVARERVLASLRLDNGVASPQDVKLSPDGRLVYVADQAGGGVWEIDASRFVVVGFLRTGAGAHGLYPSRDARSLYVSNRAEGSISVVSFATRTVLAKWKIPGSASPDMGGVSADGKTLWLSGRYNSEVYAINTETGRLRARISVGQGPHGLCVWPQPGRYSLGHTGILR
jgi:DNA-binding beta-propeller fold protein YncE